MATHLWNIAKNKRYNPDEKVDKDAELGIMKDDGSGFNKGWEQLKMIAAQADIPFAIYLHPEKGELENGDYNRQGYEIIEWAKLNGVKLYKGIDMGEKTTDFRDNIHINETGQKRLAKNLEIITDGW